MRPKMRLLAATVIAAVAPLALAQATGGTGTGGTTTGGTVTTTTTNAGQTLVATKIASNFTNLAGSTDNALALVNALRTGTDVTLTSTVAPPAGSTEPPTTTTTTFTPPTGKMGWGEVKHALALAQDSLVRAGITNPTAEQLQAALVGGDITATNADGTTKTTTLKGVLTMRAGGMGWGNIAKAGGTKLGPVTSKVKMGASSTTTTTTTTTAAGDATLTGKSKGITTASGASAGTPGLVTGDGASAGASAKGNAFGRGIVTAAGGGGVNVAANGNGKGSGAGIVNGGGGNATAVTNATNHAGGNGNGNAGGNGKGNGKGGAGPGG